MQTLWKTSLHFILYKIYSGSICKGDEEHVATFHLYFVLMNSPVACSLFAFIFLCIA